MKKVLIALDNHSNYDLISSRGSKLAKALGASLALVHVFPDTITTSPDAFSSLYGTVGPFDMEQGINLEKLLAGESLKFLEQVKSELQEPGAETFTAEGNIANAILETAGSCGADIIVLGRHSRSGIDHLLMGSVAKQVLQHSKIPLFIIPV